MGALSAVGAETRVVVLALGLVPSIDATGLVALESALKRLQDGKKQVVLSGPLPQPRQVFERANLMAQYSNLRFASDLAAGISLARDIVRASAAGAH